MTDNIPHSAMCFVVMPFGRKTVKLKGQKDPKEFNFDSIYKNIYKNAIESVKLPGGGTLIPKRADSSSTSRLITDEMFRDILLARVVFADISGVNPNVFYELATRHSLRPTGTVAIRMRDVEIPFDVQYLSFLKYVYNVDTVAETQREIQQALQAKINDTRPDSPVAAALKDHMEWPGYDPDEEEIYRLRSWFQIQRDAAIVEQHIREAERAISEEDFMTAIASLRGAQTVSTRDLRVNMLLAEILKKTSNDENDHNKQAQKILEDIIKTHDKYSSAYRELGVVLRRQTRLDDAIVQFKKALELNPYDVDAWCSLGGAFKKKGDLGEALSAYGEGLKRHPGSPYALLNKLTILATQHQKLPDRKKHEKHIKQARDTCKRQIELRTNLPWCHYMLAQVNFYDNQMSEFEETIEAAVQSSSAKWMAETSRGDYELLKKETNDSRITEALEVFDRQIQARTWPHST